MHIIDQEEPSEEFQAAWNSAGKHIQAQCRGGIKWIRVNLRRPFIEHFSFIIGNQLFFVFVEAEEFELSNRYDAFIGCADKANAVPLVITMKKQIGTYEPSGGGWGLLHAVTKAPVDPLALVSDELIEMSDWELHDFAISVVKNRLLEEGKNVYSTCSDMEINPSLWFEENDLHYWVVIRGFRHPMVSAERPDDLDQIAEGVPGENSAGYYAIVTVANSDDPFDPEAADSGNFLPLYRGFGMTIKYTGIHPIVPVH